MSIGASYDVLSHVPEENSTTGAHVDFAMGMGRWLVVAELGFTAFEEATVQTYAGGARYPLLGAGGAYRPYAQLLLGLWRCCDGDFNELVLQPGFGVDVPVSGRFGLRAAVDYRRVFFAEAGENHVRVSAGVVVAFQ